MEDKKTKSTEVKKVEKKKTTEAKKVEKRKTSASKKVDKKKSTVSQTEKLKKKSNTPKKKTVKTKTVKQSTEPKELLVKQESVPSQKEKKKDEDQEKKIIKIIILILLLLFLFWFLNVGDLILDIPSEPELKKKNEGWNNTNIVNIEKDSKTRSGVKYYLYCINKNDDPKKCKWKKTTTKNVVVTENGINYVFIKAVNEDGKEGNISDPIKVKIDNEAPEIEKVTKTTTTTTIKVKIDAIDKESGIDKYYYKIDDGEFIESDKNIHTFKGLTPNTTYKITIKVVDKLGNEVELEIEATTKSLSDNKDDNNKDDKDDDNNDNKDNKDDKDNKDKTPGGNNGGNSGNEEKKNPTNDKPVPEVVKEIPEISLEEVPSIFTYGEKYSLPSSYKFGSKGGVVSCKVGDTEYKDTSTIGLGRQEIECTATSNTGPSVKVSKIVQIEPKTEEESIFDGWITLNLYYPEKSTNWQWRLEKEGATRVDGDGWKDYTGPITVRLTDVENVYIRYTLPSGEVVVIAPKQQLVVDINPLSFMLGKGQTTRVTIAYSEDADTKEYRINGGDWKPYTGAFHVGPDTQIDARVIKVEKKYDGEELVSSKKKTNYDSVYIEERPDPSIPNIGGGGFKEEEELGGESEKPKGSNHTPTPSYVIEGPIIEATPTTLTDAVTIKITTEKEAREIYYKEDISGSYKKYTDEFIVKKNETIYAYYITEEEGQQSKVSHLDIENIKVGKNPYVRINLNNENIPKEVGVTLSGQDYDTLEYSTDGVMYYPYTGSFKVTKNCTIYAKATNKNGIATDERSITYLGKVPSVVEDLDVAILVNPEKEEVKGLINKAEVIIDYDERATEKYYRINDDPWQVYTGSFIVEKNVLITAYAKSSTGWGEEEKSINYLTTGIGSPSISVNTKSPTTSVTATIKYSRNAIVKKYKIDNGEYLDYSGPIEIEKNCTIYAYNEDELGNTASSSYTVRNIATLKRELILDKGSYFLLKLNYPPASKVETREYRWTNNGKWKTYDKQGILLIKSEYKDEIIKNGNKVQIEDEDGNIIIFTDHFYIVETTIEDMMEDLFMRWDYESLEKPEITISTEEPALSLKATIRYDNLSDYKKYKVVNPDGSSEGWKSYSGPITINRNNTIIYAKSGREAGYSSEKKSAEAYKLIKNIDEKDPTLTVIGDFETPTKKLTLQLVGEDDQKVERVSYAKGIHDAKYFEDNGEILKNRSTCKISENGTYTFYVEDSVGNTTVEEITITNIDKRASNIDIDVLTTSYGTKAEVEIDYGINKVKEYKIGENGKYKTYTGKFTINSLDVLGEANEDGTLTIYARGVDSNGNEEIEKEIVYVLDLDAPQTPFIYMDAINYPTVTPYGTKSGADVVIDYDDRDDIDNYYSIDGGKTWKRYEGPLNIEKGSVIAKSVKKNSGLTVSSSKTTAVASRVITGTVYDENTSTCYSEGEMMGRNYFKIAPEMIGQPLRIYGSNLEVRFYNSAGTQISYVADYQFNRNTLVVPPAGTVLASVEGYRGGVCEIMPATDPVISPQYIYPKVKLHEVEDAHSMVTIVYRVMAARKQYKINNGNWQEYTGPIKLELGDTIYARSIDKNGKEGETSSYKSVNNANALPVISYDDNSSTCHSDGESTSKKFFAIDPEMIGEPLKIYGGSLNLYFYNASGESIGHVSYPDNPIVPAGAVTASLDGYRGSICDVMADTTPTLNKEYHYPTLTLYGVEDSHTMININYRKMAVKKQYRINDGKWQNYTGPIKLSIGQTIYAKSVDKNKKEGITAVYKSVDASNTIPTKTYDGNAATCHSDGEMLNNRYFSIDPEMVGQSLIVAGGNLTLYLYNSAGTCIKTVNSAHGKTVQIPEGAVSGMINGYRGSICELSIVSTLTRSATKREIPALEKEPIIKVSDSNKWTESKEVEIEYPNTGYINEYSVDAKNWIEYSGKITVTEETTIYARSRRVAEIISTSSYKITKIDHGVPTVSLDGLPSEIEVGKEYSVPSSYDFNSKSSSGKLECYANGVAITTTKELVEGSYRIKCIITTEAGVKTTVEKDLLVKMVEEAKEEQSEEKNEGEKENEEPKKKEEAIVEQEIGEEIKEESTEE